MRQPRDKAKPFAALAALRRIGDHLAMWGPMRRVVDSAAPTPRPPAEIVMAAASLALDSSVPPAARAAYAMMLDFWCPEWRVVVTDENLGLVVDRSDPEVRRWRAAVVARDDHRCVRCGSTERLHAHHIVSWEDAPELRLVLDNGESLCAPCHADEHPSIRGLVLA